MMLKDREAEFTELLPVRICVGASWPIDCATPKHHTATYNVNGKAPRDEGGFADLKPWLAFPEEATPDIYAIGSDCSI